MRTSKGTPDCSRIDKPAFKVARSVSEPIHTAMRGLLVDMAFVVVKVMSRLICGASD